MSNETIAPLDVATCLPWGKPKRIDTKNGPRDLHVCKPTPEFWSMWRKPELKQQLVIAGVSVGKEWNNSDPQAWEVKWWKMIPKDELARLETSMEQSIAIDAPPDFVVPKPDGLDYLGYQKGGIYFASQRPGTLIGDDMGLGKTMQAIGFINLKDDIKKVVIVVPASVKINWYRELAKWLVRPLSVRIAEPTYWPQADIIIINFDIVHRFAERLAEPIDLAIVDEAQNIKNHKTKRGQAVIQMGGNARYRLALTGTPMENGEEEVFNIASFCDPVNYPNFYQFRYKYCGDAAKRAKLQQKLRSTIMIRRLKSEVLKDLPSKFRKVIEIPYDDMELLEFEKSVTRKIPKDRIEELKAAVELSKASDRYEDYEAAVEALAEGTTTAFEAMAELRHRTAIMALPHAITHLRYCFDELKIPKIIVFSHHRDVSDALHAAFPSSVQHYGGMNDAVKQQAIDEFQMNPMTNLFCASIRASGVGITLTAASFVLFVELDWVPGRMTQAEDRAHRIGQKDNVNVEILVPEGSFFSTMAKRIVEKQNAIDQALDKDRATLAKEPIVVVPEYKPGVKKPLNTKRAELEERALTMDPSTMAAVHQCLKYLAGMCDGAQARDDQGFNGVDTRIGHSLAEQMSLSPMQAALGQKLIRRYKNSQLSSLPYLETALRGTKPKDDNE